MRAYDIALFDLDGTITDSAPGILNSLKYAFTEIGREIPDEETLHKFLGPPLDYSFTTFCGFSAEEAKSAVSLYRSRYNKFCVKETTLFPGIREMLENLSANEVVIALATSKPTVFAKQILEGLDITEFFTAICGSELDKFSSKAEIIQNALDLCNTSGQSVMVGDRLYDIDGAKSVGIDSIGALYGYGSREELETAGATYLASSAEEIAEIITAN